MFENYHKDDYNSIYEDHQNSDVYEEYYSSGMYEDEYEDDYEKYEEIVEILHTKVLLGAGPFLFLIGNTLNILSIIVLTR